MQGAEECSAATTATARRSASAVPGAAVPTCSSRHPPPGRRSDGGDPLDGARVAADARGATPRASRKARASPDSRIRAAKPARIGAATSSVSSRSQRIARSSGGRRGARGSAGSIRYTSRERAQDRAISGGTPERGPPSTKVRQAEIGAAARSGALDVGGRHRPKVPARGPPLKGPLARGGPRPGGSMRAVLRPLLDLDLRRKIVVAAVLPAVALAVVFVIIVAVQRWRLSGKVEQAVGQLAEENLARAARDVRTLCEATHQELSRQVPRSLSVARDELSRTGALSFGRERVRWRAVNQLDRSLVEVELPRLLLGGAWVAPNDEFGRRTPVVDRVRELAGAEATIFQRMNERGDMLRVATTVPDGHGRRAIGTYIPALEPDGRPNPVVGTVVRGDTYVGRARVVDHWYLAGYEPLHASDGRVVGMLFIGLRQDSLEGLRTGVAASRIGRSGSMYVLGASGNQRGRFLIPPPGHADGEDAWEQRDRRGVPRVQRIVEAALAAPAGGTALLELAAEAGARVPRERLASVSYFAPWDWVIVAEMDRDEAHAAVRELESSLGAMVAAAIAAALALLAVAAWLAYRAAGRVASPLEAMASAAERIAQGDVQQEVAYRSRDEVGRLAEAFRGTIGYLQDVARGASAIAAGDLSRPVALRSPRDELGRSFQEAHAELRRLVEETRRLTGAAVEGRLDARADASAFRGEFRAIVEGVNATLATLVSHLDAMPVPAMIVGRDFEIRYMNASGASLLGRSQRDLVGTRCFEAFRSGDCRTARCACARAMADDREVTSETDAHPEGLDLDVVYSAVPLHDAEGRVIGGLEVVVDQTAVPRPRDGREG